MTDVATCIDNLITTCRNQQDAIHSLQEQVQQLQVGLNDLGHKSREKANWHTNRIKELEEDLDLKHNDITDLNTKIEALKNQLYSHGIDLD